jgi:hypothetical protein
MASKAEKLRRKRGRPKVEDVAREPNGRISRSINDNNNSEVARRAERLGLTVVQARDQKAATFIGYLNLLGKVDGISDDQYDAAMKFLDLRRSYLLAIKAPNAERSDEAAGNTNSEVSESYIDWCNDTVKRYLECRKAIQRHQNECRQNLWAALDLCVIQGNRMHHMVGDIRSLCNALIMFFRV